ncbi:hypothetical protein PLICRDRAFT_26628 [Plicaturopsis crispa FD-325 SS-3]|nr:hypothetical protein PLICRDRAFT_26628 [Plicaturopsis crispa FD-325 SS-3]
MHEAVTTPQTATKSFFSTTTDSEDFLLSPIALTPSAKANKADVPQLWHLPTPTEAIRRAPIPKRTMPSRTTQPESTNSSAPRWRFNGTGQLVDSEAAAPEWDLADEIVKLKINGDSADDGRGPIRTPPKNKMAVVQVNEASPLETASDTSIDSSEHPSDHQITISHSRGSSTDTTASSNNDSATGNTLRAPSHSPLKVGNGEAKERPHSFSGGLSTADLRRLQNAGEGPVSNSPQVENQQWSSTQYRDTIGLNDKQFPSDQPTYPSLSNQNQNRVQQQQYDYRSGHATGPTPSGDELQVDYNIQQRNYNPLAPGQQNVGGGAPAFVPGRPANIAPSLPYRQPARGFAPQGLLPSPTNLGYPVGHTPHLSLGNTQQLYDMMLAPPHEGHHPAVTRVQQQHNVFRAGHQHSASDPSNIRDATAMALLSGNMQAFGPPGPGMFGPAMGPPQAMSLYANQFYGAREGYPPDMPMARLQSPYTGQYAVVPQSMGMDIAMGGPGLQVGSGSPTGNGPSANNRKLGLYKTELCRSWEEKGTCRYGAKCQFAHGEEELRKVARHPKYKTEICRTFWVSGSCPYGKRCCFIHTELPASGAPPGADGAPPPPQVDGRARSMSTNSDPDASISLLARISARRSQDMTAGTGTNNNTPVDMSPPSNGFQFNARPPTGSLRVDTSALDKASVKQNKSAYPSFASNNGLMLPNQEQASAKSPAPVTAGPDLGRYNNSRVDIVGYNQQQRLHNKTPSNGSNVNANYNTSPNVSIQSAFPHSSNENSLSGSSVGRGHARSGSAGNWGSIARGSHLAAPSPYPNTSSPGGEAMHNNSPWSTSELAVGSSRLNEKAWV